MAVGDGLYNLLCLVNAAVEELQLANLFQGQIQRMRRAMQGEDVGVPVIDKTVPGKLLTLRGQHGKK
jgi:hypothetical protein